MAHDYTNKNLKKLKKNFIEGNQNLRFVIVYVHYFDRKNLNLTKKIKKDFRMLLTDEEDVSNSSFTSESES